MAKPKLTLDGLNKMVFELGAFAALAKIHTDYDVTAQQEVLFRKRLCKIILDEVTYAKKVHSHIGLNLRHLEAACRYGMQANSINSDVRGRFYLAMQPLDGWIITMLQTGIAFLSAIYNTRTAGERVKGLQGSFAKLYAKQYVYKNPFGKEENIFDLGGWEDALNG